jgi:hypothetical protein
MSKIIDASGLGHPTCGYLPDGALRGVPQCAAARALCPLVKDRQHSLC